MYIQQNIVNLYCSYVYAFHMTNDRLKLNVAWLPNIHYSSYTEVLLCYFKRRMSNFRKGGGD